MQSTHEATIPLSSILSKQAQTGHILDNLKTGSLISIGKFSDNDCVALFGKYNLKVFKNGKIVIRGTRNPSNGLWNIPLQTSLKNSSTPTNLACSAIHNDPLRQDLAGFYHGTFFRPLPSTFLRAINKGYFATWPGLITQLINKHLLKSMATSKGHMHMQQKNIQSTKTISHTNKLIIDSALPLAVSLDVAPSQEPNNSRMHEAHAIIIDHKEFTRSYSD